MSTYTRLGARGSRYAKSKARDERNADSLYDRGVLSRPGSFTPKPPSTELIIDDEFHSLIPPQTPEENAALEESLLRDGCNDALVIWQGHNILIDGHHRYELCTKHGISYTTRELAFDSREDVIVWMVQHQLGRRNLPEYARGELVLTMESAVSEIKRRAMLSGKANPVSNLPQGKTRDVLGKQAGMSGSNIDKIKHIRNNAPEPIKAKARSGEISVNRADLLTKALKGASDTITEFVTKAGIDDPERVEILKRLEKSSGSPETNGTFNEIIATGGFHFGTKDTDRVKDFATAPIQQIQRALDDIAEQHAKIASEARRQDRIDKIIASATTPELPELPSKYAVIYADPPWRYEHVKTDNRAIENHYPTMELSEICALPVQDVTTSDAILFMWATSPKLAESMKVIEAWGFTYRTCMVWNKDRIGMGYYARQQHELLLIATVGSLPTPPESARPASVISAPRGEHSRKPEVFYEVIERMYPELPKVELFSRNVREGWYGWGYESA